MRFGSYFSFIIFVFLILTIILQFPFYYAEGEKTFNFYETDYRSFFENFGIAIFSYNCLTNFFSVASTVKNPNL